MTQSDSGCTGHFGNPWPLWIVSSSVNCKPGKYDDSMSELSELTVNTENHDNK